MTSPDGGFRDKWRVVLDLPPESRLRLTLSFDRDPGDEGGRWDLAGHVVATDQWFEADVEFSTNLAQLRGLREGLTLALDGAPEPRTSTLGSCEHEGVSLSLRPAETGGWVVSYVVAQWFYIGPEADDVTTTRLSGDAWFGFDHLAAFRDRLGEVVRLIEAEA